MKTILFLAKLFDWIVSVLRPDKLRYKLLHGLQVNPRLYNRRAGIMQRAAAMGFLVFFLILWLNNTFLSPLLAGPVGGLLSPLGALGSLASALVLAFVGYWLYAFAVKKTGAEPEA